MTSRVQQIHTSFSTILGGRPVCSEAARYASLRSSLPARRNGSDKSELFGRGFHGLGLFFCWMFEVKEGVAEPRGHCSRLFSQRFEFLGWERGAHLSNDPRGHVARSEIPECPQCCSCRRTGQRQLLGPRML